MKRTSIELDVLLNLAARNVHLERVVDLDHGVGVADGATVVCRHVRYALQCNTNLLHFAELVLKKVQSKLFRYSEKN